MTATLRETQADLLRLVELASQGEDVVITVDGKPMAKLTRAEAQVLRASMTANQADLARWLKELEELRARYGTEITGPTVEQILDEDRADRV